MSFFSRSRLKRPRVEKEKRNGRWRPKREDAPFALALLLTLFSPSAFAFLSSREESAIMLSYRCAGRLRIAQPPCSRQTKQKKKSTLAQKESKTLSIALPHPCSTYLLRRGLVQRHGASAATARGHDAQVRAPRSPGQGGHEVPGHSECCFWRREIAALLFFFFFARQICAREVRRKSTTIPALDLALSLSRSLSVAGSPASSRCGPASEPRLRHRCQRPQTPTCSGG